MKAIFKLTALTLVIFFSCSNKDEVTIGTQVWTKSNLDVAVFRNGDSIPEAKTLDEWNKAIKNKQPAWCYYNNNPENERLFGKLYNLYAVTDPRHLAPEGWKIPSNEEWQTLYEYLGRRESGKKMKIPELWGKEKEKDNTNESGFSASPAGMLNSHFSNLGSWTVWWSYPDDNYKQHEYALLRDSDELSVFVSFYGPYNHKGYSVRCIRE
ncbi:fibrobacter succinogenes major paralogous domain-containing protein [Cytophaga aurantiaca]|uniref:fibrobacter succinogenes major paralogous domain-containing protein n=1 Tax=Cytophaga aurantiaca TaxID=29530 RepID=UPI000377D945|nr:fibrobacter succinogenes major paralogous domain-containing protein [Cytophaga aurantiaca]